MINSEKVTGSVVMELIIIIRLMIMELFVVKGYLITLLRRLQIMKLTLSIFQGDLKMILP